MKDRIFHLIPLVTFLFAEEKYSKYDEGFLRIGIFSLFNVIFKLLKLVNKHKLIIYVTH